MQHRLTAAVGDLDVRQLENGKAANYTTADMSTRISPYSRPWRWFAREASRIAFLALALIAVCGMEGLVITRMIVQAALAGVSLFLSMGMVADILAAGFCRWSAVMGYGLGVLAGAIRYPRHPK